MATSFADLESEGRKEYDERKKGMPKDDLDIVELKEGESIVGHYLRSKKCKPSEQYPDSESYIFVFEHVEGHTNRVGIFGTVNLVKQLAAAKPEQPAFVVYEGKKTASNGHEYRSWYVKLG